MNGTEVHFVEASRAAEADEAGKGVEYGVFIMPEPTYEQLMEQHPTTWPTEGNWGTFNAGCSLTDGTMTDRYGHTLLCYGNRDAYVRMMAYAPYDENLKPENLWESYMFSVDTIQATPTTRGQSDLLAAAQRMRVGEVSS